MDSTARMIEEHSFGEPLAKVARYEKDNETRSGRLEDGELKRETLFIRCAQIHSRGELVNEFLCKYREALGIQAWYSAAENVSEVRSAMVLRPDAPLECVFVKTSRKPYFLLECTAGKETATQIIKNLKELHNTTYKGHPVLVEVAKGDLTVATERKKLEMRDAARRESAASKSSTAVPHSKPSTALTFVPRVLHRK